MSSMPYETPKLERFGDFRTLTQVGFSGASDGCTITGPGVGSATGSNLQGVCVRTS